VEKFEGENEFVFNLTYMEACYLNAAIVEFFHKMRHACESDTPVPHNDERYIVSKKLWNKIEKSIPIMDWK
jgi:hypothetical protein